MTRQVKISMIGKVGDRVGIAYHVIIQFQAVVRCKRIAYGHIGIARISLIPVRTEQRKPDNRPQAGLFHFRIPHPVPVKIRSAVKVVDSGGIFGQFIRLSVESKSGSPDAVGVSAHRLAQMAGAVKKHVDGVIPQNHVSHLTFSVRHHHGQPHAAKIRKRCRDSVFVGKCIAIHLPAVIHGSEFCFCVTHNLSS